MVQVFGTIESSTVRDGMQITVFRIPAFSDTGARQRAKANARLKGMGSSEVNLVEKVGPADVPGQTLHDVTVVANS